MMDFLRKAVSILRMEDSDGRLDLTLQDKNKKTWGIRLWQGEGVTQLPEPEWLLRNFVQRGGLTVVYGIPGSGKSLLMLDWAQHIQLDEYWLGRHETMQGTALYVMAEGQFGLKGRLEAWKVHYGREILPPVKYHIEGVSFWAPEGKENNAADAIVAAAAALEVDVVFVDTMAATFGGGDENRQQDMNLYLKPLRELRQMGIAVVIAHHANRGEGALRGSSVLGGDADTIIELRPVFDKEQPGRVLWSNVVCRKQKDYIPFPTFRMNLKSVELEPAPSGRERSGPVFELPHDGYSGETDAGGKRRDFAGRRQQIAQDMVKLVGDNPGIPWRTLRERVRGKNTELAMVRDQLVEEDFLEYDDAEAGYYLGENEFEFSQEAEIPPTLELPKEVDDA